MESTIVDGLNTKLFVEITTIAGRVSPIRISREVELSLATSGNQMVGIDRLDERGNVLDPVGHHPGVTSCGARKVSDAVGPATRLIAELPGHDGGRVLITGYEDFDVVFVGIDNLGDMVEL